MYINEKKDNNSEDVLIGRTLPYCQWQVFHAYSGQTQIDNKSN